MLAVRNWLAAAAILVISAMPAVAAKVNVVVEVITQSLENPWGLAFLPDGRMLVTERPGRLRIVGRDGSISPPVAGVPEVAAEGQGGLLDIALAPDFASSARVYFTFAEPRDNGGSGTAVAHARLTLDGDGGKLEQVTVIFRQQPVGAGGFHFGSRLAFAPDGKLFVTIGERNQKPKAQLLDHTYGKVIRINADGSIPDDNPFVATAGARPEIWSYGHRNPQGAAINPATGKLWTVEHGARGGDEINIPLAGRNYGWPVISYGRDYSGAKIGEGQAKTGMEQPIHYWDPSIAPSGMLFYTGDLFPEWQGNLFVGALAGQALHRLTLEGDKVTGDEPLLTDLAERIRDVRQGPDGAIYVLTDAHGGMLVRLGR